MRTILSLLMAALSVFGAAIPQARPEPFVPVGVWYGGGEVVPPAVARDPASEKDAWRRDLAALRTLGFNSITTWVDWASAEQAQGRYNFTALDQILSLADEIGLKVVVHIYTDAAPEWLETRHADARFIPDQTTKNAPLTSGGFCPDHPGVRSDMLAFVGAATKVAANHQSFHAVELRSDPFIASSRAAPTPSTFCTCTHTRARLREWAVRRYGAAVTGIDRQAFNAEKAHADLKEAADTARLSGARIIASYAAPGGVPAEDDWRLASAVDHYGSRIHPKESTPAWTPARLMSVLDRIRSAAGSQGWWLGELQGDNERKAAPVSASDLRLWGWASYSRGARAISYTGWTATWMTGRDGTFTDRAKAAGELAGNLSRNVRLFAPMRPQPARVAVLDTTDASAAMPGSRVRTHDSMLVFHSLMFERNVQSDFLRQEELIAGAGSRYSVIYVDPSATLSQPVEQALTAFAGAGGTLIRENLEKTSGIPAGVERSIASARVTPEIRITGAPGLVEARFLESPEAWLLVALNHADTPQTVTMAFAPDVPEAIWQNMETGASVHFVQGPEGPTYRHQFAARDVMLLVRGKRLR